MKANCIDQFLLAFPKEGHAPMLFLEWVATRGKNIVYSVKCNNELGLFFARLSTERINEECVQYINANL